MRFFIAQFAQFIRFIVSFLFACAALTTQVAQAAPADVAVQEPWVRATVAQQKVTGAFMRLTSTADVQLVAVASPLADRVEIHEMKMDGEVMTMRAVPSLPLAAGKPVALAPGGYHLMLFGLRQQIKAGDKVPLTLTVEDAQKQRTTISVDAVAKSSTGH